MDNFFGCRHHDHDARDFVHAPRLTRLTGLLVILFWYLFSFFSLSCPLSSDKKYIFPLVEAKSLRRPCFKPVK